MSELFYFMQRRYLFFWVSYIVISILFQAKPVFADVAINGDNVGPIALTDLSDSWSVVITGGNRVSYFAPSGAWVAWSATTPNTASFTALCGSCEGDGAYHALWVSTTDPGDICGPGGDYSSCKASVDYQSQDIEMDVNTSPPPPPPSATTTVATSTVDQTQRNVWNGWWAFFSVLVFVVWLGRNER